MDWNQSYTEVHRGNMIFIVEDTNGNLHFFRTPYDGNQAFPGSFDTPDYDSQDCE